MPLVLVERGYRFFFYSNEGNPPEPIHVHVERGDDDAKIWVVPTVRLAWSDGFNRREQAEMIRIAEQNRALVLKVWNEHFRNRRAF